MDLFPAMDRTAELVRERSPISYNEAEQQFSTFVQRKLYRLLRGDDNDFMLIRRYCGGERDVAFLLPGDMKVGLLRLSTAESIIWGVLRFLDPLSAGGPIAQHYEDGQMLEVQTFPTHYPHIIVERVDVYNQATRDCVFMEWRAVRLQNQKRSTMVTRVYELGNLVMELSKIGRS